MKNEIIHLNYDIVVVGGGMSGVCAAIAGARHGANVALIQNRPVLGGNASSEIRMHICGADCHGTRPDARETGILEEILLDTRKRNPTNSFSMLDVTLWEKARFQERLDLYLNTHMNGVKTDSGKIISVTAEQLTTEKIFELEASIFIDSTGDGILAAMSGAECVTGREGKHIYGEAHAPEESDNITMGNTLMLKAIDTGNPVKFEKPYWANTYSEKELDYRGHSEISSGYWWVELGGDTTSVIKDGEELRDELLKSVFGVWDHIKNGGEHSAENYALDWVGFLPGKRESRRVIGDYVLKEQDCFEGRRFTDAVAYGGWPMDMHSVGGLKYSGEPTVYINLSDVYTIPYRALYSKDITNLMLAGRIISASHMAFGSTRVMATCSVVGQAAGTAAAMAVRYNSSVRDISARLKEMQQLLLRDDCWIPGVVNEDIQDLARKASVRCSSQTVGFEANNVTNGISRRVDTESNCWVSERLRQEGEWIELELDKAAEVREIHIKFDSNLSKEIMVTLSEQAFGKQSPGIPKELVKDYSIAFYKDKELVKEDRFVGNHQRFVRHKINVLCDTIRINVFETNGDCHARIFEIRIYGEETTRTNSREHFQN